MMLLSEFELCYPGFGSFTFCLPTRLSRHSSLPLSFPFGVLHAMEATSEQTLFWFQAIFEQVNYVEPYKD